MSSSLRICRVPDGVGSRVSNVAARVAEPVVIDDERLLPSDAVRVGEHIFVHVPLGCVEVVQQELVDFGEQATPMKQRKDLPLVASYEFGVSVLIPVGATILHPILLG